MRSGLIFFWGICVGMLVVLGGLRLAPILYYQQLDFFLANFSPQKLKELRVVHEGLQVLLQTPQESRSVLRGPVVPRIRLMRTNLVIALPEPAGLLVAPEAQAVFCPVQLAFQTTPAAPAKAQPTVPKNIPQATVTQVAPGKPHGNKANPVAPATVNKKTITALPTLPPDQLYAQALQAYDQGRYDQARTQFVEFIQVFPKHNLVPNAWYWTGETWYAQGKYDQAHQVFHQVLNAFPGHHKSADALLKMAYSQMRMGKMQQARTYLDQLEATYPKSNAARLGRQERSQLHGGLGSTWQVT